MNHLNSVLIEGELINKPSFGTSDGATRLYEKLCKFAIASYRYSRTDFGFERYVSRFLVHARGKLGELCVEKGHEGQEVRVVGRLRQVSWGDQKNHKLPAVVIEAEHVEFKPQTTSESKEKEKAS